MARKDFSATQAPALRAGVFALSAILTCSLAFSPAALAKVTVDDQELAQGDNSVGGGHATLSDVALDMVDVVAETVNMDQDLTVNFNGGNDIEVLNIEGSANVEMNFSGENEVEDTHVSGNATVTINADGHDDFEEVEASDNANVTVKVTGENDFETIAAKDNANIIVQGTDCQKRDIVNVGGGEDEEGIIAENGNVTIDHVTVNLESEKARVGSTKGNLTVDTSKIASSDDNKYTEILAGGEMRISESVVDIVGTVHSDGEMTIEHSDVEAKAPDAKYDSSPYRVFSKAGIKLLREKNGEVLKGALNGNDVWYVDTGDGKNVDLEADGNPGYYACKGDGEGIQVKKMSLTGDSSSPWSVIALALAGAAITGYAAKRRKDDAA